MTINFPVSSRDVLLLAKAFGLPWAKTVKTGEVLPTNTCGFLLVSALRMSANVNLRIDRSIRIIPGGVMVVLDYQPKLCAWGDLFGREWSISCSSGTSSLDEVGLEAFAAHLPESKIETPGYVALLGLLNDKPA